ncbi:mitochondria-eating protein [Cololabis saira]|uniref:mitochondria-eating protein n=1 Tax=Cololabis saira TaxID=129043 RepID=UPI002AD2F590|nr:mitochondria-eating protein [Cololabis saira]
MADTLRRLTNTSSCSVLQDKLESWHKDYHLMSCDQNLNRCCELIELTAKIQGQLFAILNLTAAEGGHYAGVDTLKTRLLPWLGTCFSMSRSSVDDSSLQLLEDSAEKDRKIRELSASHENDMQKMKMQLCSSRSQLESVRAELVDAQKELEDTKSKSVNALLAAEDEILQLKADLRSTHEEVELYKRKMDGHNDYERQVHMLRDEVSYLNTEKTILQDRLVRSRSPSPLPRLSHSPGPARSGSPTRAQLTNSSRHARLVSRFSDLYAVERLQAQSLLLHYIDDLEMVQRIIFIAAVESFKAAKQAYYEFKLRVKKSLGKSHSQFSPEADEDAAVDSIVRNLGLYDVQTSINNVINAMNMNPRISFPAEVDFSLISTLIRETCKVAFAMQTLDPPTDLSFASDGELYNESKYRRSYDSEFTAPLVLYHVWPALMEGKAVIVKGEAVTSRSSRSCSRNTSTMRSRSLSPRRSLGFKSRRSLSPERLTASHL